MRKIINTAFAALANFIELDAALEIGAKSDQLNDLRRRTEAERNSVELLERYARTWAVGGDRHLSQSEELDAAHAATKARRQERKANERARQDERKSARRAKEMRLAY